MCSCRLDILAVNARFVRLVIFLVRGWVVFRVGKGGTRGRRVRRLEDGLFFAVLFRVRVLIRARYD